MLTLKVFTTDINGKTETHLFSGNSIAHSEYFSRDHCMAKKAIERNETRWCIGNMLESSSDQEYIASDVLIYDEDRNLKNYLLILPKAVCWIMDNGKTIDSFFCDYKTSESDGNNPSDKK